MIDAARFNPTYPAEFPRFVCTYDASAGLCAWIVSAGPGPRIAKKVWADPNQRLVVPRREPVPFEF